MNLPLVSIICLSYNHAPFIKEALESVWGQTYANKEIIIIDDCSTDGSIIIIEEFVSKHPEVIFIRNEVNIGNCKSFNKALKISGGDYIIDFATDDVMLPQRIEKQIQLFQSLNSDYGVLYGNVITIDEKGNVLEPVLTNEELPSGDLYSQILKKYFIPPPGMMMRRAVLKYLGGYDENLAYEDFDFWVRSSRNYKYCYQPESLTKRRLVKGSHSSSFLKKRETKMSESTYRVVLKALWLNQNEKEDDSLAERIKYEMRHAFYIQNYSLVYNYYGLLKELRKTNYLSIGVYLLARFRIPVFNLYKWYSEKRN